MSKRKKHKQTQPSPQSTTVPSSPPLPSPEAFTRQITFDRLEDKIRGEEMMQEQEQKRVQESQEIKKKLDSVEIDRRMEELKAQLGLRKKK